MKILLLGSNGQLGQSLLEVSRLPSFPIGWSVVGWNRAEGDLSKPDVLISNIGAFKPDAIINAAAYTQVDRAESEQELCRTINAVAPGMLAEYCAKNNIPFVHFSTDYVYEGVGTNPHFENESCSPQNFYGKTKAEGDQRIENLGADYLIFRSSWVYSDQGKNFVKTMLKLGSEKPELRVVNDQVGGPTYALDLAKTVFDVLMSALEMKIASQFPKGIYHYCNSGFTTWADFAKVITPNTKIIGIPTSEYPTPAKRPQNSRLSLEKINKTFGVKPRSWQEALHECLNKMEKNHG